MTSLLPFKMINYAAIASPEEFWKLYHGRILTDTELGFLMSRLERACSISVKVLESNSMKFCPIHPARKTSALSFQSVFTNQVDLLEETESVEELERYKISHAERTGQKLDSELTYVTSLSPNLTKKKPKVARIVPKGSSVQRIKRIVPKGSQF